MYNSDQISALFATTLVSGRRDQQVRSRGAGEGCVRAAACVLASKVAVGSSRSSGAYIYIYICKYACIHIIYIYIYINNYIYIYIYNYKLSRARAWRSRACVYLALGLPSSGASHSFLLAASGVHREQEELRDSPRTDDPTRFCLHCPDGDPDRGIQS